MTQSAKDIETSIRDTFEAAEPSTDSVRGVSDQFRNEQNHAAGIRAPHAIDAMRNAEQVERWLIGEGASVSIALSPRTSTRPYDTLITATETPAMNGLQIQQAWRLYGDWPSTPTSALAAFVARFGLEVIVGGTVQGLFVPTYTGQTDQIAALAGEPGPFTMSVMFRKDGAGPATISWAYAINDDAYRSYVSSNR